jgi:hypothetical protein
MALALENALGAYLRPREDVLHIRRVLAIHLNECLQIETCQDPTPLGIGGPPSGAVSESDSTTTGLQRDYVRAFRANAQAQEAFAAVKKHSPPETVSTLQGDKDATELLDAKLTLAMLREQERRLDIVARYLGKLQEQNASQPNFLTPANVFQGAPALPEVPPEIMQGFEQPASNGQDEGLHTVPELERSVLNAKILRMREWALLADKRRNAETANGNVLALARANALEAVRKELIDWIETKLSQHPTDEGTEVSDMECYTPVSQNEQLARVAEKYGQYLEARRSLLQLVLRQPLSATTTGSEEIEKGVESPTSSAVSWSTPDILPYIENLLNRAHKQRALIQQKSHVNVTLARQLRETGQALGHQAEESQLLPAHRPRPGALRRNPTLNEAVASVEPLDCTSRVRPWVTAADSAKIATLEAVMEKVEEGQSSIEQAMGVLNETESLLGREPGGTVTPSLVPQPGLEGQPLAKQNARDIWAPLRGDVGLLRP